MTTKKLDDYKEGNDKAMMPTTQPQTALTAREQSYAGLLDQQRFAQLQRAATLFANSKLVPDSFRGDMPSCFVAMQLAMRMEVDPFMLMQNMYVIHGRPGLEGKFVIAMINQRGPFDGPVQWRFSGTKGKDDWACTAYAKHRVTGEVCEVTIDWATVKREGWLDKSGSKWKTMPEQMFRYRTASWLAKAYCPEVTMGIPPVDELEDIRPAQFVEVRPTETTTAEEDDVPTAWEPPKAEPQPEPEKPKRKRGRSRKRPEPDEPTDDIERKAEIAVHILGTARAAGWCEDDAELLNILKDNGQVSSDLKALTDLPATDLEALARDVERACLPPEEQGELV